MVKGDEALTEEVLAARAAAAALVWAKTEGPIRRKVAATRRPAESLKRDPRLGNWRADSRSGRDWRGGFASTLGCELMLESGGKGEMQE